MEELNYPLFLLCGAGVVLQEPSAGEALEQSASLSYHVLTRLSLSLAREPVQAQGLIQREESPPLEELAREGKRIIEARCGLPNYDLLESEMPLLHRVLTQIAPERVNQYLRADPNRGLLYLRCRKLRGVTRQPLYQELLGKNPEVRLHDDHYIACPRDWFTDLLEKFYGCRIDLDPLPDRQPPSDASTDSQRTQ